MPSTHLSEAKKELIRAAWRRRPEESNEAIARECDVTGKTAKQHKPVEMGRPAAPTKSLPAMPKPSLPAPAPEAGGPTLPQPIHIVREPFQVDNAGWWLALGDCHLPMHDCRTIELAVEEARRLNATGVLLNGDIMDCFSISPFFRIPTKETFVDELDATRQFLAWLRSRLPKTRIVYREGNHEFRLTRFIVERAQALYELPELRLENLLGLDKLGIEWVQDKRKVNLGKLTTLHGHELRKGEGINPARLAFLRTTCPVLIGHHHRTSEHHQRALDDRHFATWSVGCACYTSPDFDPFNQWNLGFAMVEVASDGWFSVHNHRVIGGRVV